MIPCLHISVLQYIYAHTLRVFVNEMLRKIKPKREEVISGWKMLHHEEFYNLYSLLNIIKKMKS
jgi:hypothetical protein